MTEKLEIIIRNKETKKDIYVGDVKNLSINNHLLKWYKRGSFVIGTMTVEQTVVTASIEPSAEQLESQRQAQEEYDYFERG